MYHNYVIRQFLNRISTWNESSALQNYVTSVQPYYMVLNYKRQYIFNFSSPIFCKVMLTLVTLSPCSFLINQVPHQQFHYFFLQFKIIKTGLLSQLGPFTILNYLYYVLFFFLAVEFIGSTRITAANKIGVSVRMWLIGVSKLPEMAFAQSWYR